MLIGLPATRVIFQKIPAKYESLLAARNQIQLKAGEVSSCLLLRPQNPLPSLRMRGCAILFRRHTIFETPPPHRTEGDHWRRAALKQKESKKKKKTRDATSEKVNKYIVFRDA